MNNPTLKSNEEISKALHNWPTLFAKYAKASNTKAFIQIINTFGPFVGVWVLMYFSLDYSYWITFGLAIVNSFFLVRIFIIQHDCGHRSFTRSQMLNKVIGWFASMFTAIPFRYWAQVHNFHHGHSGQLEVRDIGDIRMMTVEEYRKASRWERLGYRIFRMPLITFGIGPMIYIFWNNRLPLVRFKGWKNIYASLQVNNVLWIGLYVLLGWLLGWQRFLLIQLPIIWLFSIIAVWFFYVQHQHEHTYKQWRDNWDYLLAAIRGSTYYRLPKPFPWLTGNIVFHHIHHLNPKIPNYNLARCARENKFLEQYITTLGFVESLKCMFNKLWDEETQRMISFKEFYMRERVQSA